MQLFDATATIAAGGTVSTTVFPSGAVPFNLQMPDTGYTAGNITFNGSVDGVSYKPLAVADAGADTLYTITTASTGGRVFYVDGNKFAGLRGIQIVAQNAQAAPVVFKFGMRDLT